MKNEYNKKKRIAIVALSAAVVCLAGGLYWYAGTMGNVQTPTALAESRPEPETSIVAPEIKPEGTKEPATAATETTAADETEETKEPATSAALELETNASPTAVMEQAAPKPSAGKPKTPEEATPPAEPPKEDSGIPAENPDENGQFQPEHKPQPETGQPQGVETNAAGEVYVPGFGYVKDSGPNVQEDSYTDGDWNKQIGTMQ